MLRDPNDDEGRPFPTKFTIANVLIYIGPIACFGWFGPWWKVASIIVIAVGIWRSPGKARRLFALGFMLSLLIWGAHAMTEGQDWPGSPLFMFWWAMNFLIRWNSDGEKAQQGPPVKGWE